MIPLLYQKLIAKLPDSRSNPEAGGALPCFNAGDAGAIKEKYPDRRERKQDFCNRDVFYYTLEVASGQFGVWA